MNFLRIVILASITALTITLSPAQYVDFGRNKVQYNSFDWHTLSTEHFKIFYYPEMKELAEIGAAYAEDAYRIHQQDFNYSLIDTVPIIFYSNPTHFRETNTTPGLIPDGVGGFFEFIKGRVVIPFDGSLGNFKHVIKHELTHVFMTAKIGNVLRTHRQSSDRMPPLWFTEGLAELWSNDEWDATAEMVIKDAVLNGYMAGLADWENFYGTFFMYKMGQNALQYIRDTYGAEKILLLIENFWMNENFSAVMEKTIGKNYEDFDNEWLYHLKKKYYPDLSKQDNPSAGTEKIFSEGFGHKPAYYNDGLREEIYFIGNRTGYTSIYKINLKDERRKPELVLEGEKTDEFEEFHFFRSGLDISSTGILAFTTKSGESDALHLYNVRTEEIITNYHFKDVVQIGAPSFSSDGKQIIFPALDMGGKSDLYLFEVNTKKITRLTNDYYDDRDPDISPDGKTIVFSSDRTAYGSRNKYNLFLYHISDNSISYLTSGNQVDFSPQFSEDGQRIVYTSTIGNIQNIWYLDISGYGQTGSDGGVVINKSMQSKQLTSFTTAAFDPKWVSKDKIVFAAFENGGINVRMLDSVASVVDTPKSVLNISYDRKNELWYANRIKGVPKKNALKYEKEYSMDIATSNISNDPVFGTNAGGILAMSDLLGNDQYYFLIYNNSESGEELLKSFNIAISRVSLEKRLNYAYGIFHLSGKRYDFGDDFAYYERTFGGYFALSYPLSYFRRVDATVSLANSKRDLSETGLNRRALLLTNSISYVKDNAIWGPTGPLDGNRFNLTLSYTTDIQFSNVNYYSLVVDYRRYFRITPLIALATRFEYLMNEGKEARRWVMGGSWDLRGYDRFSIRGKRLWFSSVELRFPLINLFAVHFPMGINFDFPYIRGALFFDAGNAWDKEYKQTLGSVGAGVRMNLWNVIALRYDFGKRIENNFKNFQKGFFSQFFFGWDF
ncbi:MAG: hypothetical protein EHM58_17860 [Ignavibacteriae bacterium]|nr:MAG: hypothetical protein EHM58_17860 [Ignavibacteriota bacterium]